MAGPSVSPIAHKNISLDQVPDVYGASASLGDLYVDLSCTINDQAFIQQHSLQDYMWTARNQAVGPKVGSVLLT